MKVSNLVPEVYYKESRDFSYVGRLIEVLINYIKTNVDLVGKGVDENSSHNLINLLTSTLGFESKHEYTNEDLVKICSSFIYLLKHKGTTTAIIDTINILLRAQNIVFDVEVDFDNEDKNLILIEIPQELKDIALLDDVFDYILPAGLLYQYVIVRGKDVYSQEVALEETIQIEKKDNIYLGQVSGEGNSVDEYNANGRSMTYTSTTAENEVNNE